MEYYSAIKENAFESVLMRWMKLEPIIQSEVSQKEKHQHSILIYFFTVPSLLLQGFALAAVSEVYSPLQRAGLSLRRPLWLPNAGFRGADFGSRAAWAQELWSWALGHRPTSCGR